MILADDAPSYKFGPWLRYLAIVVGLLLLGWYLWPVDSGPEPTPGQIYCDAETVRAGKFVQGDYEFNHGEQQTDKWAFSGSHSCAVPAGDGLQFGFGFDLVANEDDALYRVQVWRFNPHKIASYLTVQQDGEGLYLSERNAIERRPDGWERLEIYFRTGTGSGSPSYRIYVFTQGQAPVYFDDLLIEPVPLGEGDRELPVLRLRVGSDGMRQLEDKREEALRAGLLVTEDDDWVDARIDIDQPEARLDAEIRLKGDWLDHLRGRKWSFRVDLKPGYTWRGMTTFSVHRPAARSYLSEWLLHRMWEREDVLTTRYDFVKVYLDGEYLGIYAYEEHFEKQLVENRDRREGPILRFNEDGLWASVERQLIMTGKVNYELQPAITDYDYAWIRPFNESKTRADSSLYAQYLQAVTLLEQYRTGGRPVSQVFDLERAARYFAISDVFAAYHGIVWHNQRYYFNPVTDLLEPIGYDGFSDKIPVRRSFLGQGLSRPDKLSSGPIFATLFQDTAFVTAYVRCLEEFTSPAYLDSFLSDIQYDLLVRQSLLNEEIPDYRYDIPELVQGARYVRSFLFPYREFSVLAYRNAGGTHSLVNYHELPVVVTGTSNSRQSGVDPLDEPLLLPAASPQEYYNRLRTDSLAFTGWDEIRRMIGRSRIHHHEPPDISADLPPSARYLHFQVLGLDSVYRIPIQVRDPESAITSYQELFGPETKPQGEGFVIRGKDLVFTRGRTQTDAFILIPPGFRVFFEAGAELDMINGAGFISRSPVFVNGTDEEPVVVRSSDGTGNGFTVLRTNAQSRLHFAQFEGLNTLSYRGWNLTGAVTFYEADVRMEQVAFLRNHCEDGLNIIRSEVDLNKILVSETPFDGFDCDFCRGTISQSIFSHTGNDGLDFSGSRLEVTDCTLESNGDKGVSVGEASEVAVFRSSVSGAVIGLASKDNSVLVVDELELINCEQGFAAYQKKPEYGGGNILIKSYTAIGVKRLYRALEGSRIEFYQPTDADQ